MASVGGDAMHVGSGWRVPGSDRQQRGGEGTHDGGSGVVRARTTAAAGWWWLEEEVGWLE
ncbi:hypothetical protein CVT25_001002 [Psilocybe cyanescens]|uniref:Uncharacterized protein n=1 Tax=Psilocybe cyanescens TaxID=93625 RepID=A0A409XUV7_PSICY|nr:hypothetical protein CVT25_001002 [Psilocybe cyanescens]